MGPNPPSKSSRPGVVNPFQIDLHPRSLTGSLLLKNDGWKLILSFWDAEFSRRAVKLPGSINGGAPITYKSWDDPPSKNPPKAKKNRTTKMFFEALFPEELPEIGRRTRGGGVGGWESWGQWWCFFMLFVLLPPVLGKLIDATKNKKRRRSRRKERDHLLC